MDITIPKQTDIVFILFAKNPLKPESEFIISQIFEIGSSFPCTHTLQQGNTLRRALRCLLNNGFNIECKNSSTDISGFIVLQRK